MPSKTVAHWPPSKEPNAHNQRIYWYANGNKIPEKLIGRELPARAIVQQQQNLSRADLSQLLDSTRLFINLPGKFFQSYLTIQNSTNPIHFPAIMQNKNVSVRDCMNRHPAFASANGPLNPRHWKQLGWGSKRAYNEWLDSSMLFAFSHCNHYCAATRLIDADRERNLAEQGAAFHFKQYSPAELANNPKKTHIFSVTGFEYRGFVEKGEATISSTIPKAKYHSQLTMEQILLAAETTETTDIILIPFGMGVFIKGCKEEKQIRTAMMEGMVDALKAYDGRPVTMHCCGWPDFYKELAAANNPKIRFIDGTGYDAYTLANHIQDQGDEKNEMESIPDAFQEKYRPRQLKSMLINAGDNDWTALLENTKVPGQFSLGHSLYHQTSDEYYALITNFALYSIQNLLAVFKNLFTTHKIIQLTNLENKNTVDLDSSGESSLSHEQLVEIDQLITKLGREYDSCWPYPNKARKLDKINGLDLLVESAKTMSKEEAINKALSEYPNMLEGDLSTRTADLIDKIRNNTHAPSP